MEIIDQGIEYINNCIQSGKEINNKQLLIISGEIRKNNDIEIETIYKILKNLFIVKFKSNKKEFDWKLIRNCEKQFKKYKIPKEYIQLEKHFNKLKNLPQPEQKSQEWFDYRYNRITASDTAAAIDQNPYEPVESFIVKKSDPTFKFLDNQNVYHGKKYEPIATSIYEYIYNNKVIEFGALPSEKYPLLGASPDGICSSQSLEYKFSPLLGRMLEIKCVTSREIHKSGNIIGYICPYYYYCQVQQQLECCELNKCDFWQCKIIEYKNRNDYLIDKCDDTSHTIGTNAEKIEINNLLKKGILIKYLPKVWTPEPDYKEDNIHWKSKFIYPDNLLMDENEYDSWLTKTMSEDHPELSDYYFDKIIYWKLEESHNVTIEKDNMFIKNILSILNDTWSKVVYYRNNLNKLNELKSIVAKRKKYIKFNTQIQNNNNLVNNKIKFLDLTKNINIGNEDFID
jgi:putative phage-type endonuclease